MVEDGIQHGSSAIKTTVNLYAVYFRHIGVIACYSISLQLHNTLDVSSSRTHILANQERICFLIFSRSFSNSLSHVVDI